MIQWRHFQELTAAETAFIARHHVASDALEVCCRAGETSFSVVESTSAGYRWVHFSADGEHRESGIEDSRKQARDTALSVQRLWTHRCGAAGKSFCRGY